ncbi:MAG: hypothetical protein GXX84_07930 [Acidobacteria bacterium]|nr:hypothetical protein [Acidobacteriota bacterium]
MSFIKDADRPAVKERLRDMRSDVTLSYFTQDVECDFCRETRELLEELSSIEEKIRIEVYDFKTDQEQVRSYRIDKIPATVVSNGGASGIRFYGIPAGYEFSSLLDAILMVSRNESGLSDETRKALQDIKVPVHLQVFTTPT